MKKYIPLEIEKQWQEEWDKNKVYSSDLTQQNKYYVLAEFPYPSGDLHMGHWFTFGGADIFARFKRMQGYQVFFPNGFDAFGLPAENAAIKRNIHPQDWTMSNIEKMKEQFASMGPSFSFDHQVITCLPEYYRWNQWIFIKMFEKGLAYRGKYLSNWCNSCQTVLANEGVEAGKCWRCGTEVVQKEVDQWFFKITAYADRLLWSDQSEVDWPQSVREGQNQWIGKSEGMEIAFNIKDSKENLKVYTSYPETIFGVTYLVIAPEHALTAAIQSGKYSVDPKQLKQINEYISVATKKSELERKAEQKDKTGVFTGLSVINPANNEEVPVWIADYVLNNYGTGAVMGVPGSDFRDYLFAKTYSLPIIRVVGESANDSSQIEDEHQVLEKGTLVNSSQFTGLKTPDQAREKISNWLQEEGSAQPSTQYHIHDWSISRQRYWGTPVPMIHCGKCGIVPVPEKDLPIELPYDVDYTPKGRSPLASNEKWLKVSCPKCGGQAERDSETLDTFVDSSWYFFRYISPKETQAPFDTELAKTIMPVDIYFGGAEHTLGHTLYSRFFTKFFKDQALTDLEEYAKRRINHGIVLGPDGNKMSKSKGNVVNPDEEVKKYGADAVRVYLAFFMPYEGTGPWISDRIWGAFRFLDRTWALVDKVSSDSPNTNEDNYRMHTTIKRVTEDIEAIKYNTAVAALMEWLNYLSQKDQVTAEEYQTLLKLLSPIAPHITEELWHHLKLDFSIHQQAWPEVNEQYLQQATVSIAVQVNGKVREVLSVASEIITDEDKIVSLALASEKIQKHLKNSLPSKTIYIAGKILSFVV